MLKNSDDHNDGELHVFTILMKSETRKKSVCKVGGRSRGTTVPSPPPILATVTKLMAVHGAVFMREAV